MTDAVNPFLKLPENPNYLHRARHHDYHMPARYLLTLHKNESTPPLCSISGSVSTPQSTLTLAGEAVKEAIEAWPTKYPEIYVAKYVIMPDHVHVCVFVLRYLDAGLSRAVASLMGKSTNNLKNTYNSYCGANAVSTDTPSFFAKGFNDRIAYNDEQWERQQLYVADNPRRYLLKKAYPDFFYRRWRITINDWQYMAVGNVNLLKNPDLQQVRFSSKYAPGVFDNKVKQWERCIENNGVLVSPFIHPNENDMQKRAINNGAAVIRICENGFAERFAPSGKDFDLMAEGRLLIIGNVVHNTRQSPLTYIKAQSLNSVAERIVATNWLLGQGTLTPVSK